MEITWSKVIEQAIGIILGGGITVFGIWAKELLDRKRTAQTWYEDSYITNGIDRSLAFLKIKYLQLTRLLTTRQLIELQGGLPLSSRPEILSKEETSEVFPLEALVKLELLLGVSDITASLAMLNEKVFTFSRIPPEKRSLGFMQQTVFFLNETYTHLTSLRQSLLGINIKRKSDAHRIKKNKEIEATLQKIRSLNEKWIADTAERSKLISEGR